MNDQENQKNMIMAIVLSLAVLLGWQYLFVWPKEAERQKAALSQKGTVPGTQTLPGGATPGTPTAASGTTPGVAAPGAQPTGLARDAALKLSPRIAITTPKLTGSLALKGGRIDDIVLAAYKETIKPDSANVVLLEPAGAKEAFFAEFGWVPSIGQTVVVPNRDTVWTQVGAGDLTPATPVTLTYDNGQGQVFRRTIGVDDKYMFTVRDEVDNKGSSAIVMQPYGKIFRLGTPKTQGYAVLHEGLIGVLSPDTTAGLQEIVYGDLAKEAANAEKIKKAAVGEKPFTGIKGGWLGFTDKYWATVLIPPTAATYNAHMTAYKAVAGVQEEGFQTDYLLEPVAIPAGTTQSSESRLFAGAKEVRTINAYAATGIKHFDQMIDWGWFGFIVKPLFWLMERLYGLLGNFGFAILAMTVLVKGAFFPLASKSYESMAKMKKMQPEMEKLKEQYKDDREGQQKAMMKLYSEHKINPASGCLPMLLQFPVFFALYKVLVLTLDMRHAPFMGWIRDLSVADPSNLFNLFGLLPFDPTLIPLIGEYLHMGFWPLLMGITMWLTMQLNPQQADPTQQMIFNYMPIMFTFMMAAFPAGLVIYWAWSNLLSLFQQYYIMKKNGAEVHLWKNMGLDKWIAKLRSKNDVKPAE
jgi:YidC/Oxa1 family membrane protein insertase